MAPIESGLSRIHQISMRVHDVDRAVDFYRDALGLTFLFAAPPRLAFFDCGGVRLMLSTPEPEFDHPGSVLYFAVDDIQHAHQTLTSRGVTFKTAPIRSRRSPIAKSGLRILVIPREIRWR